MKDKHNVASSLSEKKHKSRRDQESKGGPLEVKGSDGAWSTLERDHSPTITNKEARKKRLKFTQKRWSEQTRDDVEEKGKREKKRRERETRVRGIESCC